ncbi:MAG: PilZ domain-containing protein [Phycisphaeraceae bacterium JB051]
MPVEHVMAAKLGVAADTGDHRDQRRQHERFEWRINLQLRIQDPTQNQVGYQEMQVVTHDLCAGGFSYLSKAPLNRNIAVLACMPHLKKDRCVIGKVRYCQQEIGLQYRIGVKFLQRVDVTW